MLKKIVPAKDLYPSVDAHIYLLCIVIKKRNQKKLK